MAFQAGSTIRPELGNADYSGFARAAEIQASALANLGRQIGEGIENYQKNKDITIAGLASLEGQVAADPTLLVEFQNDTGDAGKAYKNIQSGDYKRKDVLIAGGFASSYANQQKITQEMLDANRMDPTASMKNYNALIGQDVPPAEAREMAFGSKGGTNITVGGEGSLGDTIIRQTLGKDQEEFLEKVQPALNSIPNLQFMEKMLNVVGEEGEIITGRLGPQELFLKSVAKDLGFGEFKDVDATQAYLATAGRQVGQVIRLFGSGTGLSDADREYAEKIAGGSQKMTKEALQKLVAMAKRGIEGQVNLFNNQIQRTYTPDIVGDPTSKFALARLITPTEGLLDYDTSVNVIDGTGGTLNQPSPIDKAEAVLRDLGL